MNNPTCNADRCTNDIGRHGAKGYCSKHYKRFQKYGDPLGSPAKEPHRTCEIDGCGKPSRSRGSSLCPKHYHRQYRHGDVNLVSAEAPSTSHGRRYLSAAIKGHPLAKSGNKVYVHRQVLFDAIGPGVHSCNWCGTAVEWFLDKVDPRAIHVDHLNGIGDDNRLENLVPSCRYCNETRAIQARSDALRAQGFWSCNDTVGRLRDPSQRRVKRIESSAIL